MTHVFYTKLIGGKLYPRARRDGEDVAYVNDIHREGGRVVSVYVGIRRVPRRSTVEVRQK